MVFPPIRMSEREVAAWNAWNAWRYINVWGVLESMKRLLDLEKIVRIYDYYNNAKIGLEYTTHIVKNCLNSRKISSYMRNW